MEESQLSRVEPTAGKWGAGENILIRGQEMKKKKLGPLEMQPKKGGGQEMRKKKTN